MKASIKQQVINMVNDFDVDGDVIDYAYAAHELLEKIVEDIALEESAA